MRATLMLLLLLLLLLKNRKTGWHRCCLTIMHTKGKDLHLRMLLCYCHRKKDVQAVELHGIALLPGPG
jgi:hypothetical protein